ncbi:YceK/YidQ family lipoprotein [Pasteurella multocida]|nr:YceK/YidQ family lipoprotein [Pasteurella multocida]MCL7787653.1 YceK/YidQ family lipoprotein [Pasteurella multocida]MCL7795997.1 YceK/YidQ family lipoprotein [Pasteurella multocida]MCL7817122.1 YceK/YidQ family lipoprotein [Pasteurella multocida]MDC4238232.1 YceK/YidQ family lipoprotein [Pasteurella multocida]URI02337.1 YceK/YidQ family lipoprotein [Pasteurella multocida]
MVLCPLSIIDFPLSLVGDTLMLLVKEIQKLGDK